MQNSLTGLFSLYISMSLMPSAGGTLWVDGQKRTFGFQHLHFSAQQGWPFMLFFAVLCNRLLGGFTRHFVVLMVNS